MFMIPAQKSSVRCHVHTVTSGMVTRIPTKPNVVMAPISALPCVRCTTCSMSLPWARRGGGSKGTGGRSSAGREGRRAHHAEQLLCWLEVGKVQEHLCSRGAPSKTQAPWRRPADKRMHWHACPGVGAGGRGGHPAVPSIVQREHREHSGRAPTAAATTAAAHSTLR